MTTSLKEARLQYTKAKADAAESLIKSGWSRILVAGLEAQEHMGWAEPDFSEFWMNSNYELYQAVADYHESYEIDIDGMDNLQAVINAFRLIVGEQMDEFGVELKVFPVHSGFESAMLLFFLRPGQQPSF